MMKKSFDSTYGDAHGINSSASKYLVALRRALKSQDIPQNLYSLNGYAEDRVCLDNKNCKWTVYIGTRGQKADSVEFNMINEACLDIIGRVTDSVLKEKRVKEKFNKLLGKRTETATPFNFNIIVSAGRRDGRTRGAFGVRQCRKRTRMKSDVFKKRQDKHHEEK